jgi:hypothetical protein
LLDFYVSKLYDNDLLLSLAMYLSLFINRNSFPKDHMPIKSNFNRFILVSALALAASSPSFAFFPLISDDAGTQGAGGNQLELDYLFQRQTAGALQVDGIALDEENTSGNFLLSTYTRGLTDNVDIFFGASRQLSSVSGWNNTEIGLKWVFAGSQSEGWGFAVKPRVILPVSTSMQDSGLGNAETNGGITLIGSYLGDGAEVHFNAGYLSNHTSGIAPDEAQRSNLWSVSVAPVLAIDDKWKLALDFGLQTNPDQNSQFIGLAEIAVVYAPVKNVQLGLGIITSPAINGQRSNEGLTVTTGVTWQF